MIVAGYTTTALEGYILSLVCSKTNISALDYLLLFFALVIGVTIFGFSLKSTKDVLPFNYAKNVRLGKQNHVGQSSHSTT